MSKKGQFRIPESRRRRVLALLKQGWSVRRIVAIRLAAAGTIIKIRAGANIAARPTGRPKGSKSSGLASSLVFALPELIEAMAADARRLENRRGGK